MIKLVKKSSKRADKKIPALPRRNNKGRNNIVVPEDLEPIDKVTLDREVPEELRDPIPEAVNIESEQVNWSQPQNRSDDLIEERDPFVQQPELDTQIPPELIQQRAYRLYEQRGLRSGDDLADWFEAERQLRGEIFKRAKTKP